MTRIFAFLRRLLDDGVDLTLLIGAALVSFGLWRAYEPAGIVAAGVFALATGLLLSARGTTRQ